MMMEFLLRQGDPSMDPGSLYDRQFDFTNGFFFRFGLQSTFAVHIRSTISLPHMIFWEHGLMAGGVCQDGLCI